MESTRRILVDGVDTEAMFRVQHVLRAVPQAMQPPRLVLALVGVLLLVTVGSILDLLTAPAATRNGLLATHASDLDGAEIDRGVRARLKAAGLVDEVELVESPLTISSGLALLDAVARRDRAAREGWSDERREAYRAARRDLEGRRPIGRFAGSSIDLAAALRDVAGSAARADLLGVARALRRGLVEMPAQNWREQPSFIVVMGGVLLLVWTVIGGAISRVAACDLSGGGRIGVRDGMAFGVRRAPLLAGALFLPFFLGALLILLMALPALLLGVPWLGTLVGALWAIVLIAGAFFAFLLVFGGIAMPMLVPVVACEHCDPVDALQRAIACILRRPLHLVACALLWMIGLVVGIGVVSLFLSIVVTIPASLAATWSGGLASSPDGVGGLVLDVPGTLGRAPGPHLASAWAGLVGWLLPAWVLSYLASGWTAIYLVVRRASDGRDLTEIWQPDMISGARVRRAPEPEASDA